MPENNKNKYLTGTVTHGGCSGKSKQDRCYTSVLITIIFFAFASISEPDMDTNFSPNFLDAITIGEPGLNPLFVCPTPPDSVSSVNSPSPCAVQSASTSGLVPEVIPSYVPRDASNPGQPSSAAMLVPYRYQSSDAPNGNYPLSASLPVGGADQARRPTRKPQLTSALCSEASIKILNPKLEYDKIQRKHGPRGKISEQRILNGQVRVKCSKVAETNAVSVIVRFLRTEQFREVTS